MQIARPAHRLLQRRIRIERDGFLTTDPNRLVAPLHPKAMPVLLRKEDDDRWLTCSLNAPLALAKPFPPQLMT